MVGKVFLSHSSNDKALVRRVFNMLGSLRCVMDEYSFEAGLPNWEIIQRGLDQCEIFALFASQAAFNSAWVMNEVAEARRRLGVSAIKRILIFAVDGIRLADFPTELRDFAIYLTLSTPETIVQAIQRHLLELDAIRRLDTASFVGRDEEVAQLKSILINMERRPIGISVSGLPGMGRSALVMRVLQDLEPALQRPRGVIDFHVFQSCADLALEIYSSVRDLISIDEVDEIRRAFTSDDPDTCGARLAEALETIHEQRQYVMFADYGGIINHAGNYTNIVETLLAAARKLSTRYTLCLITRRRPPPRLRDAHSDVAFLDVHPLSDAQARQYINQRARNLGIAFETDELAQVIGLGRGVPQNLDFILSKCRQYPPATVLSNLEELLAYRRDRSRDILADIELSDAAARLLSVIRNYFHVPAEFIARLFESYDAGAQACAELLDKHVALETQGIYSISPALWDAIDRDERFSLSDADGLAVARAFVDALNAYQADGVVPINIINAGSVAAIVAGQIHGNFASQFILPSHYIYLARRCYDRRHWSLALSHADAAIAYGSALTRAAFIQACRILGMSAARLGQSETLSRACRLLNGVGDTFADGTAHFVRGFDHRLNARFLDAERELKRANTKLREEPSVERELATVKLLAGNPEEALSHAERALTRSPDSPFILDMVARARIARARSRDELETDYELSEVMARLEQVTANGRLSLFALRSAELNLHLGQHSEALRYANLAISQTPDLAAPYVMRARCNLAAGGIHAAQRDIEAARNQTRVSAARHRHLESEVIRAELSVSTKERRWTKAIRLWERLQSFGCEDAGDIAKSLVAAIRRDRRTHTDDVVAFLAAQTPSPPKA